MFDIEKEEMQEAAAENSTPAWETAEWENVTDKHADQRCEKTSRKKISKHKGQKRRNGMASAQLAFLAIGLSAIGWAVRDMSKLAITLGVIALMFGLISAYCAGKCSRM